jgi:hypothetical protein
MRWDEQEISNEAGDPTAMPGLDRPYNLVRSVRTPEFAGITFHEVLAKPALNHVPKAAGLPLQLDGQSLSGLQPRLRLLTQSIRNRCRP